MQEFLDTAFSFPTIVFTISTVVLLGFWIVATLLGAGLDAFDDVDLDVDADVDADVDFELDGEGSSILRGALDFLGITGMPLLIAVNLISVLSWLTSGLAVTLLGGADSTLGWLLGIPVLIGSFLVGGFITGRVANRFSHLFVPTLALRHRELVGNVCTITTGQVNADFGQAEVRDDEGSSLLVQVRCAKENDLGTGDRVLIFDLDTTSGVFHVSPDKSLAP